MKSQQQKTSPTFPFFRQSGRTEENAHFTVPCSLLIHVDSTVLFHTIVSHRISTKFQISFIIIIIIILQNTRMYPFAYDNIECSSTDSSFATTAVSVFRAEESTLFILIALSKSTEVYLLQRVATRAHSIKTPVSKNKNRKHVFFIFYLAGLAKVTGNQISEFPFINHAMQIFFKQKCSALFYFICLMIKKRRLGIEIVTGKRTSQK